MRQLSLTDSIFYNLGDRYITAVCLLDRPCSLGLFKAEMAATVEESPALKERVRRRWPGFVADIDSAFDIDRHIVAVTDHGVVDEVSFTAFVDRLRKITLSRKHPAWCAFVLNPAGEPDRGRSNNGAREPLSAVLFQFKHGLSDGMRGLQVVAAIAGRDDIVAADTAGIRRVSAAALFTAPPNPLVDDGGIGLARIDRRGLAAASRSAAGVTDVLVAAADRILRDQSLIDRGRPLSGRIAHTRVLMRRPGKDQRDLGNHLETTFTETRPAPAQKNVLRLPRIEQAQGTSWSQHLVAKAPPPIARLAMRIWISKFDAMISLMPGPPRPVSLGGAPVAAIYGVPPLSGPIALAAAVITYAGNANFVVIPHKGAPGTGQAAADRLTAEILAIGRDAKPDAATP